MFNARQTWGIAGTGIVAELVLAGGAEGALQEAEAAVDRLAATPADDVWAAREIMLPRLRALLARAHDDELTCNEFVGVIAPWRRHWASRGTSPWQRR